MQPAVRSTPIRTWSCRAAVALAAVHGACDVVHERGVDTVVVVDTAAVRVDTVTGIDGSAGPNGDPGPRPASRSPGARTGRAPTPVAPSPPNEADLAYLHGRQLLVPVAGVRAADIPDTFDEARGGGARRHHALDILAPRGTPVLSADAGQVAKLLTSKGGGLTIYATDPSRRFVYFYAHLDRYDPRVREGMAVRRGDTIGYVGTTGNAPPNTPHLHFAVTKLGDPARWWAGAPINPLPLLTGAASNGAVGR